LKIETITTVRNDIDNLIIRDVPVSSTIVELNDHSLAIIDTGSPDNPELLEELEQLGYTPEDFSVVINTHLHTDHIGGNRIFTNARVLISRQELEFETKFARILQESEDPIVTLRSMGRYVNEGSDKLVQDLVKLVEEYPVTAIVGDSKQIEFFEDEPVLPNSITLLKVPGHSIDSRAVLVQGKIRTAVAAGDAFYHRDLWREVPIIGIHYNDRLFRKNVEHIARFPDIIIPGHDRIFDNLTKQYLRDDYLLI